MKARIGSYGPHAGQQSKQHLLHIELLKSDEDEIRAALGDAMRVQCTVDEDGVLLYRDPDGLILSTRKADNSNPERLTIQRNHSQIKQIKFLPKFSLVLTEARVVSNGIFVAMPPVETRLPPRQVHRRTKAERAALPAPVRVSIPATDAQPVRASMVGAPIVAQVAALWKPKPPSEGGTEKLAALIELPDGTLASVFTDSTSLIHRHIHQMAVEGARVEWSERS